MQVGLVVYVELKMQCSSDNRKERQTFWSSDGFNLTPRFAFSDLV